MTVYVNRVDCSISLPCVRDGHSSLLLTVRVLETGFLKKDIGRVIGLHHPVLQTGFNEEGGAIKVPHAAQERGERQGGRRK